MMNVRGAAVIAAVLLLCGPPAYGENPMGYRLLSAQDAARLPHNQGALGLKVERARQMTDAGMTFDIMRVTEVRRGSAAEQAGLKTGDEIIAVDGRVFPSLQAFAAYVGSAMPGSQVVVDYMPAGGGPQQAQRVVLRVGRAGEATN
jgi:S1-C subfamily serine protease